MSELQIIKMDGKLLVDSREVAKMVKKDHSNLMRDIRGYVAILENSKMNSQNFFISNNYKTEGNNKTYDCFLLTKKGCDMVANKLTGEKGILFTATYVTKFEEMESENKQLQIDNKELHTIAISNNEQVERQYKADKVRYSWKRIRPLLENCTYKEIEDEVSNIINFHANELKKKDRCEYVSHKEADKTEYKQLVRDHVYSILGDIYNTTLDGKLRTVVSDVKESVQGDKLETTNRSFSQILAQVNRKDD
ncbi:Rha family transcriptional regulator [Metabacillus halosaccharovorans]|uniref:Rha family transcriptional regulator n=1 Tax=Metabacillus halosaccharovorans TaxID=930124 RepID=UPI0034CF4B83